VSHDGDEISYFELNRVMQDFGDHDHLIPKRPFNFVVNHFPWFVWSAVMRRDAILRAGVFDRSFKVSEDFDLIARMSLQAAVGLYRSEEAICYKRENDKEGLTRKASMERLTIPECNIGVCKKLLSIQDITSDDRKALNKLISSNIREIANYRLTSGDIDEARALFQQSFNINPSIVTMAKYVSAYLPVGISSMLMRKNERRKRRRMQKIKENRKSIGRR
jgi:hypothetical protein